MAPAVPYEKSFAPADISLSSAAFAADGPIPARYTGEGEDVSPALRWSSPPEGTESFAVICHDPDAPVLTSEGNYGFAHWSLYNIPGEVRELPEGCDSYTSGVNDFGALGYNGPMPPEGHGAHRYYFWIIALDSEVKLEAGLSLYQLLKRIQPHTLGLNRLVGTYRRG
jgi:Raf kinase inhibitor-like YbhB/YbcL family protein